MDHSALIDLLGGPAKVARRIGTSMASVSEWRRNGIPDGRVIELAADIERAGGPSRTTLRPDDWHLIWPELIGTPGVPGIPEPAKA